MKQPRVAEAQRGPTNIRRPVKHAITLRSAVGAHLIAILLQKVLQNLLMRSLDLTHLHYQEIVRC